jgi:hypothetical protein
MFEAENNTIQLEKEDQCWTCTYVNKGIACPLMEALASGIVSLTTDTLVQNCDFYKPFRRNLKAVSNAPSD